MPKGLNSLMQPPSRISVRSCRILLCPMLLSTSWLQNFQTIRYGLYCQRPMLADQFFTVCNASFFGIRTCKSTLCVPRRKGLLTLQGPMICSQGIINVSSLYLVSQRFGLEGCEALLPGLRALMKASAYHGVKHMEVRLSRLSHLSTPSRIPSVKVITEGIFIRL